MKKIGKVWSGLLAVLLVLSMASCASGSYQEMSGSAKSNSADGFDELRRSLKSDEVEESVVLTGVKGEAAFGSNPELAAALKNQKIITIYDYQFETEEYDQSVAAVEKLCAELNGYVEYSNVFGDSYGSLRSSEIHLRIPTERIGQFKQRTGDFGSMVSSSMRTENVTQAYVDTELRLKNLRAQQDRLLEHLKETGTMADIVEIENALTDVVTQIEELSGTLRNYDSYIDFTSVRLNLMEVSKVTSGKTPITLGDRIQDTFQRSLGGLGSFGENLVVFFIGGSPVILLLAVLGGVAWLIVRTVRQRRAARKRAEIHLEPKEEHGPFYNPDTPPKE